MKLSNYPAVSRLWRKSEGIGLNESDSRAKIAIYLKRNPRMSFIAREGKTIVGAVLCGHDGRRGYLHHLAVAKNHRGNGLGKRLVDACLAVLERAGITRCNIFLFNNNAEGQTFWRHNGWAKRDEFVVMQKSISQTVKSSCSC